MSPWLSRNPVLGIAAAAVGVAAAAAAGLAADRATRYRAAMTALETPELFEIVPDEEHIVLTDDGVPLHVEIDLPHPEDAAAAAVGTVRGDRPENLPTVVLTHGYCLSLRCWIYQRRAFRDAGFKVISWDQRGHGRSGRGSVESYIIDRLGADLHAVIAKFAPDDDLVLIGHSMGGMTIMAFGEQYPEVLRDRVTGVAFIGTSPGGLTLANGGRLATIARTLLERLGPSVLTPLSKRPDVFGTIRRVGKDVELFLVEQNSFASPVPRGVVRYTADILLGTPLDVINGYLKTFDGFDKRPVLAQFRHAMVLVFNGRQDILTPPAHSELIVEAIPGAEHVLVNDAGHVIMLEHPELLNEHLIDLIEHSARAHADDAPPDPGPRVRKVVTDVAKARRLRRMERQADEIVRAGRGTKPGTSKKPALAKAPVQRAKRSRGA